MQRTSQHLAPARRQVRFSRQREAWLGQSLQKRQTRRVAPRPSRRRPLPCTRCFPAFQCLNGASFTAEPLRPKGLHFSSERGCTRDDYGKGRSIFSRATENGPAFRAMFRVHKQARCEVPDASLDTDTPTACCAERSAPRPSVNTAVPTKDMATLATQTTSHLFGPAPNDSCVHKGTQQSAGHRS